VAPETPRVADLTIDALAQVTGMTVRTIRSHAARGLLQPPEVRARTGYYGPAHVARLRLIQDLQARGYNLAAIKHLVGQTEGSVEDVLSFARALLVPFEREQPEIVDSGELAERFGGREPKLLERAVKLGLLVSLGQDRYEVPSPTLLRASEAMVALGMPLEKALDMIEQMGRHADGVAELFVRLFLERVWQPARRDGDPDWTAARESLEKLRPLASEVLLAVFHQRMTAQVERAFARELRKASKR
jgi:DNA-binding transcriptional MerR regulator